MASCGSLVVTKMSFPAEYVSPNGDASTPGPDLPSARAGHCAVKLSTGKVMLLGGGYYGKVGKSDIIFDPDTFNISLPSLTTHRLNFGCAVFKSAMHDNREVVLAVGGLFRATAEVLDYTQPNAEWTQSNYKFIVLPKWLYTSILNSLPCKHLKVFSIQVF